MAELIPNVGRGSKNAFAVVPRTAFEEVNLDATAFPGYCNVEGASVRISVSPESYRHLAKLAPDEQDAWAARAVPFAAVNGRDRVWTLDFALLDGARTSEDVEAWLRQNGARSQASRLGPLRVPVNPPPSPGATALRESGRPAVAASPSEWGLHPGEQILRTDLHGRYGGRVQGGMTTSRSSPNIFLFTDPHVGEQHGYFDGWEGADFHYTGKGRHGDQELRDMNLALLEHKDLELAVRLFRAEGSTLTYLGQFDLDDEQPVYRMDAPQQGSTDLRQVLVFKLVPRGIVLRESRDDRRLPAGLSAGAMEAVLEGAGPLVDVIPVEEQHVSGASVTPSGEPYEVTRAEQPLVLAYKLYLEERGSTVGRLRVVPSGEATPIRNDVYDTTRQNLVEAKATGTRAAVRMALGQLLDYGRFAPEATRAVLLPTRPRSDLEQLLLGQAVYVIWTDGDGFADNASGAFT